MRQVPRVLIIEDDPEVQGSLASVLSTSYGVGVASSGEDGLAQFEAAKPDVVLLDLMLPQMSGMAVLRAIKQRSSQTPVMMMTGFADVGTAVQAIKLGAADFLEKPLDSVRLYREIDRILESRDAAQTAVRRSIIGASKVMERVWRLIERFGPTDVPVLLQGETGTGKGAFAKALHDVSKRAGGPFVVVDCATLPDHLAESELFGYEEGAFTGAGKKKAGKVSFANDGTLFIDEIGVLSLAGQAKLLRLSEERGFLPLGARDHQIKRVNARFVSATNLPLESAIAQGTFREDLFHRLSGITIDLPPLRERDGDIDLLAHEFAAQYSREANRAVPEIASDCMDILRAYSWPGNIRELQRVMSAAVILADEVVLTEHLPPRLVRSAATHPARSAARPTGIQLEFASAASVSTLDLRRIKEAAGRDAQKRLIVELLQRRNMSQQELAHFLGLDPKTLRSRLREIEQERRDSDTSQP